MARKQKPKQKTRKQPINTSKQQKKKPGDIKGRSNPVVGVIANDKRK
jgi:hypothetical protein